MTERVWLTIGDTRVDVPDFPDDPVGVLILAISYRNAVPLKSQEGRIAAIMDERGLDRGMFTILDVELLPPFVSAPDAPGGARLRLEASAR